MRILRWCACVCLVMACNGPPGSKGGWVADVSNTAANLHAVRAFDSTHVLAVGEDATTVSFIGGAWRERKLGSSDILTGIWGPSGDDVIIVGGSPGRGVVWHTTTGFFTYDGMAVPNN